MFGEILSGHFLHVGLNLQLLPTEDPSFHSNGMLANKLRTISLMSTEGFFILILKQMNGK